MARITVNDCLVRVPNRFELALLAAERTRQLSTDDTAKIASAGDPRTVVALREIAAGAVDVDALRDRVIERLRRVRQDADEIDAAESDVFADLYFGGPDPAFQPAAGEAVEGEHSDAA